MLPWRSAQGNKQLLQAIKCRSEIEPLVSGTSHSSWVCSSVTNVIPVSQQDRNLWLGHKSPRLETDLKQLQQLSTRRALTGKDLGILGCQPALSFLRGSALSRCSIILRLAWFYRETYYMKSQLYNFFLQIIQYPHYKSLRRLALKNDDDLH